MTDMTEKQFQPSGAALTEAFAGYGLGHRKHSDVAIAPQANELEALSLYHQTSCGEAAPARKRRDDALRRSGDSFGTDQLRTRANPQAPVI